MAVPTIIIQLPNEFTPKHEDIVVRYILDQLRGYEDWRLAPKAFDILKHATIECSGVINTFQTLYHELVDARFADTYLHKLMGLSDIPTQSAGLWADFARQIVQMVNTLGWQSQNPAEMRLFLSYLLYWWNAFARGYAFEVEIFQDLTDSGVNFQAHDLLDRHQRFSPSDLTVVEQAGDIKTSTYFLHIASTTQHDFYIVRFANRGKIYTVVVMLNPLAWDAINGDTVDGELSSLLKQLPLPVRIRSGNREFVTITYDEWKRRILKIQEKA